jgi:hypothetical protein
MRRLVNGISRFGDDKSNNGGRRFRTGKASGTQREAGWFDRERLLIVHEHLHGAGASGPPAGFREIPHGLGGLQVPRRSGGRSAARSWGFPMSATPQTAVGLCRPMGRIGWLCARRLVDARAWFLDRVQRIEQEVYDHSLHRDPVTIPGARIRFEMQLDLDRVNRGTIPEDAGRLADDALGIERLKVGARLLEQSGHTPDHLVGVGAVATAALAVGEPGPLAEEAAARGRILRVRGRRSMARRGAPRSAARIAAPASLPKRRMSQQLRAVADGHGMDPQEVSEAEMLLIPSKLPGAGPMTNILST